MRINASTLIFIMIVVLIATNVWIKSVMDHHQAVNLCALQRRWSTELAMDLDVGKNGEQPIAVLLSQNARLLNGDLKVPNGNARISLNIAQSFLTTAISESEPVEDRINAIGEHRKRLNETCEALSAATTDRLYFGHITASFFIISFTFMIWRQRPIKLKVEKRVSRFRSALRAFPDGGLLIVNRETKIIEECNTQFAKKVGFALAGEIIGMRPHKFAFMPEKLSGKIDETTEDIEERKVKLRHRDGTAIESFLSVLLVDAETAIVRIKWCDQ